MGSVVIAELFQRCQGLVDSVALGPVDIAVVTGVVEPILRTRS